MFSAWLGLPCTLMPQCAQQRCKQIVSVSVLRAERSRWSAAASGIDERRIEIAVEQREVFWQQSYTLQAPSTNI